MTLLNVFKVCKNQYLNKCTVKWKNWGEYTKKSSLYIKSWYNNTLHLYLLVFLKTFIHHFDSTQIVNLNIIIT